MNVVLLAVIMSIILRAFLDKAMELNFSREFGTMVLGTDEHRMQIQLRKGGGSFLLARGMNCRALLPDRRNVNLKIDRIKSSGKSLVLSCEILKEAS